MEEVDLENADDLLELEARLYAQIHHGPSDDTGFSTSFKKLSPIRHVTATSVVNNKPLEKTRAGRYWNDKKSVFTSPKAKSLPHDVSKSVDENSVSLLRNGDVSELPTETVDKSFQSSEKNLSNLRANPSASGNGPNKKGSTSSTLLKNVSAAKPKKPEEKNKGPFARQINKLASAIKYDKKRQKANMAKKKARNLKSSTFTETAEAIQLFSSQDSDEDDVIEVPLSPAKILTIESSSEDESPRTNQTDFVKPKSQKVKENPSRCTSPCSVVSDDFITQSDRTRHMKDCERPDDEDLLLLQEDVDSLMENPQKNVNESTSGPKRSETNTYRVTEASFRAYDVYESESDSVYSKGAKNTKPSLVVRLEHESSSSDSVEEVNITQKTKRLRKRASSSNKESDTHIESTDSEDENQIDMSSKSRDGVVRTNLPFIAHGEALEKYEADKPSETLNNTINSSDNEFLSTLRALGQSTPCPPTRLSEPASDDEVEPITARTIAEKVLEKENANKQLSDSVTDTHTDCNEAIPTDSVQELSTIFDKIDHLNESSVVIDDSDESDKSVELIASIPSASQSREYEKRMEIETGDPIYNIVYSEGNFFAGGIGWNDEMRKFYNESWKGERFSVNSICSQMKTAKSLWKIYTDDRFPKFKKNSNQKCLNCMEFGHFRSKCPKPKRPLVCYMCGERGHHEPRCPNTVCLRCGNKTRVFTRSCNGCNYHNRLICPICKVRGHNLNFCPDKWRRYHSTTKPNEYPNSNVEYKNRKFCCICGGRGHLAEHCRNGLRFSEYPIAISEVRSHQKSYDDIAINSLRTGIGFNLMYNPSEDLAFGLAENKTKQQYYGRFLIAVGMGYLLRRKRRTDDIHDGPCEKQPKTIGHFKEYVVNPFAQAALGRSSEQPSSSGTRNNEAKKTEEENVVDVDTTTKLNKSGPYTEKTRKSNLNQQPAEKSLTPRHRAESSNTFKRPDSSLTSSSLPKEANLEIIDSDSNYSFSDHFDVQENTRGVEPMPDFIPIADDDDVYQREPAGISKIFVSADTDDEEAHKTTSEIPCEAKIYLTNFHSKFLQRPDGNQFLIEKSKANDIKARLETTSVGDLLVLHGLRENQDKLHMELLHRFRELSDNTNRRNLENSQKVPKKTEVLIRFLRENICLLQTNLGNVNELSKLLPKYEQLDTKNGWKAAEKTRRLLNMILIGQAGLRNGATHLDRLLSLLRKLIDECRDEVVPKQVREEIENNWKVIFTSHRHENYAQLVKLYQSAQVKNRLKTLNIDPRLLGKNMLDTTLTIAQKAKMDKCNEEVKKESTATPENKCEKSTLVSNPAVAKFQASEEKTTTPGKKRVKQNNSSNVAGQQQAKTEVNSPVANKIISVKAEWENKCVNLLTEIDNCDKVNSKPISDSKASSVFWSREAMPYIDDCIRLGKSNAGLIEKLSRVQIKSSKGLLSYNDYRAIIKIHNAIKGKK